MKSPETDRDLLLPFILEGVNIRGALVRGTKTIAGMRDSHRLGPLETLVLGQAYVAGGLLSSTLKGRDRLSLRLETPESPLKGLVVETNTAGDLRGYLYQNPILIEPELLENPPPDLLWGQGILTLTRFPEGSRSPFTGQVEMEPGSLARSLARYFLQSEQTPSAFTLSVSINREGVLTGAGGLFLQTLPGADDAVLAEVEEKLHHLPSPGGAFSAGVSPRTYIEDNLGMYFPRILEPRGIRFFCPCSAERFAGFISALPRDELEDMAGKGPFPVQTVCRYCNRTYEFSQEEIVQLLEARRRQDL